MVSLLSLVHGEAQRSVSISMHNNRLAWAAAFVAIVTALIPPQRGRAGLDGVIIGLMLSVMAMIKVTYFISFAGPILVALLLTRQGRTAAVAAITGVAVIAVVTVFAGVDFWMAYAGDLLSVAGSEVRSAPANLLRQLWARPPIWADQWPRLPV